MTEVVSDRELEAVLKLVELTQAGKLKWKSAHPWGDLQDTDDLQISRVFLADFGYKRLRLYVEKRRKDKPDAFEALSTFIGKHTYPYWSEMPKLEITNGDGASLWVFPHKPAISDLLKAVQRQASGANDLIDHLLSIDNKSR